MNNILVKYTYFLNVMQEFINFNSLLHDLKLAEVHVCMYVVTCM